MEKRIQRRLVRRIYSERYLLITLVSFALSVSAIRFFLEITGYPQIGSDELHFAHVLWGGLLLFASSLLPLIFVNKRILDISALLSGTGVGLFIDEVGNFIEAPYITAALTEYILKQKPKSKIICLDVLHLDKSIGYVDDSGLTTYHVGESFVDFGKLEIPFDRETTLLFFDDHQNAPERIFQAKRKGFKWCFFNDNYPSGCG